MGGQGGVVLGLGHGPRVQLDGSFPVLLGAFQVGFSGGQLALGLVDLLDAVAGLESLPARLGRLHRRFGREFLFVARPVHGLLVVRLGLSQPGFGLVILGGQLRNLEVNQRLARLDLIALGDGHAGHPTADFGAQTDFLNLHRAGQFQHIVMVAERPVQPHRQPQSRQCDRSQKYGFPRHGKPPGLAAVRRTAVRTLLLH